MKITREADYALRIVAMLAGKEKQIEARVISEENDIPYRFTLKILRKMVQAGLIKSYRGVNGGYILNKEPSEISLREVIEVIDGKIEINRCLDEPEMCKNTMVSKVHEELTQVQRILSEELDKVTFQEICG
jgi:Rrf2 family protein